MFGPGVSISTVNHPFNPKLRHLMFTEDVVIGNSVWVGANVVILSRVTIDDNSIIGLGSVVTIDIPKNSLAVGNAARVDKKDMTTYGKGKLITNEDLDILRKLEEQ